MDDLVDSRHCTHLVLDGAEAVDGDERHVVR